MAGATKRYNPQNRVEQKPALDREDSCLRSDLSTVMNRYSIDNDLNTPDFILAKYICTCLKAYRTTKNLNEAWHNNDND